jgi:large subunit ribosomal protein L29
MKVKELREKSDNQLQNLIKESKEKLRKLKFSLFNKQLKNYKEISQVKKTIARAKTILKERSVESDNSNNK